MEKLGEDAFSSRALMMIMMVENNGMGFFFSGLRWLYL
jgi:hypothetical protein